MSYSPPIKGKLKKSLKSPIQPMAFAQDIGSVSNLVYELRSLREDIIQVTDRELEKIDLKIAEVDSKMESALRLSEGPAGQDADEQKIADYVLSQIRQPEDGEDADPEMVIQEVLKRLPRQPNEAEIVSKILKQIPSPKASLKVIREELQLDKEVLLEDILNNPKFKTKIDGMNTTLERLDKRYIHGGGFNNIANSTGTVSTGLDTLKFTGATVTQSGRTVTVAVSGGAFTSVAVTPTPDDTTLIYTAASTISAVVINGSTYINGSSAMGGTISIVGTTITLPNPIGTGGDIYGIA